jgi:hypothetical protein
MTKCKDCNGKEKAISISEEYKRRDVNFPKGLTLKDAKSWAARKATSIFKEYKKRDLLEDRSEYSIDDLEITGVPLGVADIVYEKLQKWRHRRVGAEHRQMVEKFGGHL